MSERAIYFIRHKFTGLKEAAPSFEANRYIGFHFADEFHERKEDYKALHDGYEKGFGRAYDAFHNIGHSGAIVVFEYNNPNHFYVATVPANQKIQPFHFTMADEEKLIYKILQYGDVRQFNYASHPVLLALRPPYSTVCQPGDHFRRIIKHLYLGEPLEKNVNLLHPKILEQLCENYLRSDFVDSKIKILYTTMKTGKTLPIVDIVGRSEDGHKLLIQITHHSGSQAAEKAQKLVDIQRELENTISIMFSGEKSLSIDGLDYHFTTHDVFSKFQNSPVTWHQTMLNDMLGAFS